MIVRTLPFGFALLTLFACESTESEQDVHAPKGESAALTVPEIGHATERREALEHASKMALEDGCTEHLLEDYSRLKNRLPSRWIEASKLVTICNIPAVNGAYYATCDGHYVLTIGLGEVAALEAFYEKRTGTLLGLRETSHVACSNFGRIPDISPQKCSKQSICGVDGQRSSIGKSEQ